MMTQETPVEKLLKLTIEPLIVSKNINNKIIVCYNHCDIKGDGVLIGKVGKGNSFEEACADYLNIISGKTLVFYAGSERRREVTIL